MPRHSVPREAVAAPAHVQEVPAVRIRPPHDRPRHARREAVELPEVSAGVDGGPVMRHDSRCQVGVLTCLRSMTPVSFGGACVGSTSVYAASLDLPTPGPRPTKAVPGFCFWRVLTAPRASVVSLNGLLGRVHTRRVVHPARPAGPVSEGSGQAGVEW